MTDSPHIALERVSFRFADGVMLFDGLSDVFDNRHTGLVGRNGVGKSILGRLLAGELQPSDGRILRQGRIAYLPQRIVAAPGARVVDLAGCAPWFDALQRVMAGEPRADDIECLDGQWDVIERLQRALQEEGLGHLDPQTPAMQLSGGECSRVALLGALLAEADLLILDEPGNHLDLPSRKRLGQRLASWRGGLVLISHDRELLAGMQRIVELSAAGLRSYGGGYAFYQASREQEREAARQMLDSARVERKRGERELRQQQERQQQRSASGRRQGKDSNQAKILLDMQKGRSESSAGRTAKRLEARRQQLDKQVQEAAAAVVEEQPVILHGQTEHLPSGRRVLYWRDLRLPFGTAPLPDFELFGSRRVAVLGPNGCGKSSLLAVLAGRLTPLAGQCRIEVPWALLDQHLHGLDAQASALEHLQRLAPGSAESLLRTRLVHLGVDAEAALLPSSRLSGGQRLKVALAGVLASDPPPQLLLLDEPDNHIDLDSRLELERFLRAYRGALLVISHDSAFLDTLALTDRLQWTASGWLHEAL
ncbi:ATP-binding cassette domain-containing protein [Pseudomonas sp. GOM7]|uniref:ATP-binding cassette domain-containing protein n=1 Tax=Pseudomonas sp. GOM7 TaxID=2998079 RepID=UPI00227AE0E2|nr:ATP-binding cassette domain-containing protein [Pseudomonas sp. GOM7]WAJ37617.1 ATP-binding cassette domain-containing protein [Pseudomonas sp. GOM7]